MDGAAWDARYAEVDRVWSAAPNRWVVEEAASLPPGRALDLAAGEGRHALWLAARGWTVTAVDFSDVALDKGRRADEHGRVRWLRRDLLDEDVDIEERRAELVLMAYLHLGAGDRRAVIGRAVRSLVPGGSLLVIGHDTTNITQGTGGPQDAAVLFTPDDVVADLLATAIPMRVDRAHRVERQVDGAPRPALDALVHAVRL